MTVYAHHFETQLGEVLVCCDEDGRLVKLALIQNRDVSHLLSRMGHLEQTPLVWDGPRLAFIEKQIQAYLAGQRCSFHVDVAPMGPPFHQQVWQALQDIPYGETRTYGQLAKQLGKPGGARAVGLANGANPIAIVIPCHRVIGSNGQLTGYAYGVSIKAHLLKLEGALPPETPSLFPDWPP